MKIKLLALGLLLSTPFLFSSCRSCKGGGWYKNRNLNVTVAEQPPATDICAIIE